MQLATVPSAIIRLGVFEQHRHEPGSHRFRKAVRLSFVSSIPVVELNLQAWALLQYDLFSLETCLYGPGYLKIPSTGEIQIKCQCRGRILRRMGNKHSSCDFHCCQPFLLLLFCLICGCFSSSVRTLARFKIISSILGVPFKGYIGLYRGYHSI